MKVRLQASDSRACSRYRLEEPARTSGVEAEVTKEPFDIYESPFGKVVCARQEYEGEDRVVEITDDVMIFQRPCHPHIVECIPLLQARGVAVVVDLDDDLGRLVPKHPSYDYFKQTNHHTEKACALADLVTCTTPALAERYGAHGRVVILPNCVPERLLDMPRGTDSRTIGWSGFQDMHPGDLETTNGAVQQFLEKTNWNFRQLGPPDGISKALGIGKFQCTGPIDMEDYYLVMGTFTIGIAPLEINSFNQAKSYLKGLEMAARGVPFVGSQTDPYKELGLGLLCQPRARNWRTALFALEREDVRAELVEQGDSKIRQHHTYETQGWRWAEAWGQAMDNRAYAEEMEFSHV